MTKNERQGPRKPATKLPNLQQRYVKLNRNQVSGPIGVPMLIEWYVCEGTHLGNKFVEFRE